MYKRLFGIFLFCLDLALFAKNKKDMISTHSFFIFLIITEDLNKITFFVDIIKQETCAKFQKKILNFTVVGARQSFQLFRQINWFLENNRPSTKLLYGILHYVISLSSHNKISP